MPDHNFTLYMLASWAVVGAIVVALVASTHAERRRLRQRWEKLRHSQSDSSRPDSSRPDSSRSGSPRPDSSRSGSPRPDSPR